MHILKENMENTQHAKSRGVSRPALTKPVSIRFTQEEVGELKRMAGKRPLSEYVRNQLFSDAKDCSSSYSSETRLTPKLRQKLLAQTLMRLGRLDIVQNLNQTLQGLQTGLIDTSPEVCAALEAVHEELKALRRDLLKSLGLRP